jgi:2-polyprenyl-6-methoxyphenol hydroxylase-like FAD-dependent oxidoreductase
MARAGIDTDVLIVGAGPVGLFLANECVRRGLRSRIIEANASQSIHSKALAIFPRTLEILDMAGVVTPFLEKANRVTSVAVVAHDRGLGHMRFAPEESPYPFIAMLPQDMTERLLVQHLENAGGAVEYETKFVSAAHADDHVKVDVLTKGKAASLTASFVVGCDGAHSAVRHRLDLPFEGGEYTSTFMLADVETNDVLSADEMQLCPNERGPIAIFPISARRRRIVGIVEKTDGEVPSLQLVQRLIAERGPNGMEARALHWSSYFRIHHRQAAQMRIGRIFIAGDAAHIHSPFGGQGMNTGLHDIWNLVWKLDLAVRGHATESLLDSYATERCPVIAEVIETTDRLTRAMGTPSKLAQVLRDMLIPPVSRLSLFQHALVNRLSGLGIDYHGSPIVEGAGKRFFDDSVRGGKGIGSRFLLVARESEDAIGKAAALQLAQSLSDIVELRFGNGNETALVRPDGYLAYSASHRTRAALNFVRSLLARQAH